MSILAANVLALLILIAFLVKRWSITRSVIEPGFIFAVNLIVLYPVRGFALYFFDTSALPDYPLAHLRPNLELASWLSVLGSLGYVIGYQALMGRRKLSILQPNQNRYGASEVLVCFVLFAGTLAGITYKIATGDYISYLLAEGRYAGLSHIATLLTGLQWPAFLGVWILWFKGHRDHAFIILFILVNCVVIPYQFLQGSKTFLSLLLVSAIFAFYWSRGRLPKIGVFVAITLIVTIIFPFVHDFRENVNTQYGKIPSISKIDTQIIFKEAAPTYEEEADLSKKLAQVSARFGGIDQLFGITDVVPLRLPYKYGFEYTAFFVNLIPRMVWPGKPIYSRGATYGATLGTMTSVTPFPYGEAYWDMGTPGTFIMMAIWGGLLALVTRLYERYFRRPHLQFLIAVYFLGQIYWISGGESSMPSIVSGLTQHAAMILLVYAGLSVLKKVSRSVGAI